MNLKILNKTTIAKTPYLNLVNTSYLDKEGNQKDWVSAERPGNQNAVVVVAYVDQIVAIQDDPVEHVVVRRNKLVVTKEYRIPIGGYEWGMCAGLIEPGMSIEETAVKELKEETGLDVVKFLRLPTPFIYNSPGLTSECCSYAFVEATGEISGDQLESSEDITVYLYDRDQVKDLMEKAQDDPKTMIGAKSWLIFDRFVRYGDI